MNLPAANTTQPPSSSPQAPSPQIWPWEGRDVSDVLISEAGIPSDTAKRIAEGLGCDTTYHLKIISQLGDPETNGGPGIWDGYNQGEGGPEIGALYRTIAYLGEQVALAQIVKGDPTLADLWAETVKAGAGFVGALRNIFGKSSLLDTKVSLYQDAIERSPILAAILATHEKDQFHQGSGPKSYETLFASGALGPLIFAGGAPIMSGELARGARKLINHLAENELPVNLNGLSLVELSSEEILAIQIVLSYAKKVHSHNLTLRERESSTPAIEQLSHPGEASQLSDPAEDRKEIELQLSPIPLSARATLTRVTSLLLARHLISRSEEIITEALAQEEDRSNRHAQNIQEGWNAIGDFEKTLVAERTSDFESIASALALIRTGSPAPGREILSENIHLWIRHGFEHGGGPDSSDYQVALERYRDWIDTGDLRGATDFLKEKIFLHKEKKECGCRALVAEMSRSLVSSIVKSGEIHLLEEITEIDPTEIIDQSKAAYYEAHLRLALYHYKNGDLERGRELASQKIDFNISESAIVYGIRAAFQYLDNDPRGADAAHARAIKVKHGDHNDFHYFINSKYISVNDFIELARVYNEIGAEDFYEQAIQQSLAAAEKIPETVRKAKVYQDIFSLAVETENHPLLEKLSERLKALAAPLEDKDYLSYEALDLKLIQARALSFLGREIEAKDCLVDFVPDYLKSRNKGRVPGLDIRPLLKVTSELMRLGYTEDVDTIFSLIENSPNGQWLDRDDWKLHLTGRLILGQVKGDKERYPFYDITTPAKGAVGIATWIATPFSDKTIDHEEIKSALTSVTPEERRAFTCTISSFASDELFDSLISCLPPEEQELARNQGESYRQRLYTNSPIVFPERSRS